MSVGGGQARPRSDSWRFSCHSQSRCSHGPLALSPTLETIADDRFSNGDLVSGQTLRIGTRKSAMALAQTEGIARLLRAADPALDVEIVKFETRGDQAQTSKLLRHGGKGGAFVAEIREAMRAGQLQAAMHSLKDVPGNEETPGLVIAAMLPRDPANDALVLRPGVSLEALRASKGKGFKIGTNAVRRAAYLRQIG